MVFFSVIPIFIWCKKPAQLGPYLLDNSLFKILNNVLPDHRSTVFCSSCTLFLLELSFCFHCILRMFLFSQFINLFWFHLSSYPGQTPVSISGFISPLSSTKYSSTPKLEHCWRKLRHWCAEWPASLSTTAAWCAACPPGLFCIPILSAQSCFYTAFPTIVPLILTKTFTFQITEEGGHLIWTLAASPFSVSDSSLSMALLDLWSWLSSEERSYLGPSSAIVLPLAYSFHFCFPTEDFSLLAYLFA